MDKKVYIVQCTDYANVETQLSKLLGMMGGIEQFVALDEAIMLKVNLLMAAEPEQAITTHPAIVENIGQMTRAAGADVTIVDSPGGGYDYRESTLKGIYRKCGLTEAAQKAGLNLNFDTSYQEVSFLEGRLIKHFDIITPLLKADGVINLCKLKTHTYMGMTGAVKNNFGAIPGRMKAGYHAKLHDTARFAQMLLDLASYVNPRLSIMDAVIGMEGDGPNSGDPRHIGLLLAATNPLALDLVASEIIGLPRNMNPLLSAAEAWGLHPTQIEEVEIIGADMAALRIPDFKFPQTMASPSGLANLNWWQRALQPLFKDGLTARPHVLEEICVGCGVCQRACPMHAIALVGNGRKHAQIDPKTCIRCYCCHEMCPQDAIELKKNWLYNLVNAQATR